MTFFLTFSQLFVCHLLQKKTEQQENITHNNVTKTDLYEEILMLLGLFKVLHVCHFLSAEKHESVFRKCDIDSNSSLNWDKTRPRF